MEQAAISEFRLYRLSSVTLVPHVFVCDISGNSQKLNLENRFIDQGRRSPLQQQQQQQRGGSMEIIQIVTIFIILTLQLPSGGGRVRWLWLTNDVN